jgi:hypothetical protein
MVKMETYCPKRSPPKRRAPRIAKSSDKIAEATFAPLERMVLE